MGEKITTREQLNKIYYLSKELELWKQRKEELEADIPLQGIVNDGMPHQKTNKVSSPTEQKAIRLAELTKRIEERIIYLEAEKLRMEALIVEMEDPILKQAIYLHCIKLYSWRETARRIGGSQTPEALRQIYSRYCKTLEGGTKNV